MFTSFVVFFAMSTRVFRFTIEVFWVDDKKYGDDLIETIDFYDELEIIHKCYLFYLYI
jgi:hypothetical protein